MTDRDQVWISDTMDKIREKIGWVSEKNKDKIPYTTDESGDYDDRSDMTKKMECRRRIKLVDKWVLGRYHVAAVPGHKG